MAHILFLVLWRTLDVRSHSATTTTIINNIIAVAIIDHLSVIYSPFLSFSLSLFRFVSYHSVFQSLLISSYIAIIIFIYYSLLLGLYSIHHVVEFAKYHHRAWFILPA